MLTNDWNTLKEINFIRKNKLFFLTCGLILFLVIIMFTAMVQNPPFVISYRTWSDNYVHHEMYMNVVPFLALNIETEPRKEFRCGFYRLYHRSLHYKGISETKVVQSGLVYTLNNTVEKTFPKIGYLKEMPTY